MVKLEGERALPGADWAKLTDARILVGCVPDVDTIADASQQRAVFVLRPGFSFVRGTLDTELALTGDAEQKIGEAILRSRGIGSTCTTTVTYLQDGDVLRWTVEIEAGGLLKAVPAGLIRGAAQKIIDAAWDKVAAAVT